jgi:uncharacterized protein
MKNFLLRVRTFVVAASVGFVAVGAAFAQTTDNARYVAEVMVNAQFDQGMEAVKKQMPEMIRNMSKQATQSMNLPANESEKAEAFFKKMQPSFDRMYERFTQELSKPEIRVDLIDRVTGSYKRVFSVAEIDAMAAYYRSPLGASALTKMGALMGDMLPAVNEVTMRAMQPAMSEMLETIKKSAAEEAAVRDAASKEASTKK